MGVLRTQQKERLRKNAIQASRYYQHYLLNKTFIVVTEDYLISSITFLKRDFYHLTGLTLCHLLEDDFYDACYAGTLNNSNLSDNQHYDYSTLKRKSNTLLNINKFLYADASTNLFLSELTTHTCVFPCAIRNDKENMTVCFAGNDNHAHSLRKAVNSNIAKSEKMILGIFEKSNGRLEKCVYSKY